MVTVSVSQVETWERCKRWWAFDRARGYSPETVYSWRGHVGHELLEAWGRDRSAPALQTARIAAELCEKFPDQLPVLAERDVTPYAYAERIVRAVEKAITLLPEPPWPAIEHEIEFEIDNVRWRGFIDLAFPELGHVFDHKFSGSDEHALLEQPDPEQPDKKSLQDATQPIVYSKYLLLKNPALKHVKQQWTYSLIGKTARAWPVQRVAPAEEINAAFEPINATAKEIVHLRVLHNHDKPQPAQFEHDCYRVIDPNSLPATPTACPAMGGCPYLHTGCAITPEEMLAAALGDDPSNTGETDMGLIDQLNTKEGTPVAGARSDTAAVEAECRAEGEKLKAAGVPEDMLATVLAAKFVGLGLDGVKRALNPPPPPPPPAQAASAGNGSAVNPPPFEGAPTTAQEPATGKGKGGRKIKTTAVSSESAEKLVDLFAHVSGLIKEATDANAAASALLQFSQAYMLVVGRE